MAGTNGAKRGGANGGGGSAKGVTAAREEKKAVQNKSASKAFDPSKLSIHENSINLAQRYDDKTLSAEERKLVSWLGGNDPKKIEDRLKKMKSSKDGVKGWTIASNEFMYGKNQMTNAKAAEILTKLTGKKVTWERKTEKKGIWGTYTYNSLSIS